MSMSKARATSQSSRSTEEGRLLIPQVNGEWESFPGRAPAVFAASTQPGAGEGIRTPDPLITNQMLYQLSYAS